MIIQHFDIRTPKTQSPQDEGWEQTWHGYQRMTKCWSEQAKKEWDKQRNLVLANGYVDEWQFELDCFLSVLADIKKEHVNMFELGAGWGQWCMALAGVIDHRIIPITPISYRCLAVEGEPTHYQWLKEHFEIHNINGTVVYGAVSDKNGICRFSLLSDPDINYGQAVIPLSRLTIRKIVGNIYNLIFRKIVKIPTIEIPMYTVDHLMQHYSFDHVDIIDMDVQGAEYDVIQGAAKSINDDLIDYLLIGTHDRKLNDKLRRLLLPKFDLIVDIYPNSVGTVDGFAPIKCQDGIQLYKRKNI